jgi:hypothetical protein
LVGLGYEPALSSKQDLLSMRGVDISPHHKETKIQNNVCYETALSSKQDLLSMRGVDISPQNKETKQ